VQREFQDDLLGKMEVTRESLQQIRNSVVPDIEQPASAAAPDAEAAQKKSKFKLPFKSMQRP
jgi:hypothetical protein